MRKDFQRCREEKIQKQKDYTERQGERDKNNSNRVTGER